MNNHDLYATIIGALLPPLIAVVVQTNWSARVKSLAAILICVLVGTGASYYEGVLNWQDVGRSIMLVIISAMTFYRNFYKPTGISGAIQNATNIGEKNDSSTDKQSENGFEILR